MVCAFIGAIWSSSVNAGQTQKASSATGPSITIPSNIPAVSDGTATVPLTFTANGEFISSIVFSIDFDETRLTFDPADNNFDGIPDAVVPSLPFSHIASIVYDGSDTDGEIDVTIFDATVPLAALSDGNLMQITFGVKTIAGEETAPIIFSFDPPLSFGNTSGNEVIGMGINGSIAINSTTTNTITPTPSATSTGTITPTPEISATPTATPNTGGPGSTTIFIPFASLPLPTYSISGSVTDTGGNPLSGAIVSSSSGRTATSDVNGNYVLDILLAGSYTISAAKTDYAFSSQSVQITNANISGINFVGSSTAPPTPTPTATPSSGGGGGGNNGGGGGNNGGGNNGGGGGGGSSSSSCGQLINNGGFELSDSWNLEVTEYPAAYSNGQVHSGGRAMRVGITNPADNRFSYSSAAQTITLPPDTTFAKLSYQIYPTSTGTRSSNLPFPDFKRSLTPFSAGDSGDDAQYTLIIDHWGRIHTQVSTRSSANQWQHHEFELGGFRGQTIQVYFGVFNNGYGGITGAYIDEVSVTCSS